MCEIRKKFWIYTANEVEEVDITRAWGSVQAIFFLWTLSFRIQLISCENFTWKTMFWYQAVNSKVSAPNKNVKVLI